jgi:hypothetical protein
LSSLLALALTASLPVFAASASQPIAIEDLARLPAIQSVSMSPDGNHLVALIPSPGNPDETALATWDIADLAKGPKVVTPSGDRMKFIAASALKADKVLVVGRQEWTGRLGGCGEGKVSGATKTFVTKVYLTDAEQKKFDEAFASEAYTTGISAETRRCLELGSTASLAYVLPLDPDRVIIQRLNELALSTSYYLYNLRTNEAQLLFRGDPRSTPALFDPRSGRYWRNRRSNRSEAISNNGYPSWIPRVASSRYTSRSRPGLPTGIPLTWSGSTMPRASSMC